MTPWRIYFTDGSTFDGDAVDTPKKTIQVILNRDPRRGRRVLKLTEYYVYSPTLGMWTDQPDSCAALIRCMQEPWAVIRRGEYMLESEFEQILIRAHNDPDFKGISVKPHAAWSS